jgi:hypothetical protein
MDIWRSVNSHEKFDIFIQLLKFRGIFEKRSFGGFGCFDKSHEFVNSVDQDPAFGQGDVTVFYWMTGISSFSCDEVTRTTYLV